jgi:hypothetical protein
VSNVDRYKLWNLKRRKQSGVSNDDDEPNLTDSEEEDKDEGLIKLDPSKTDLDGIKMSQGANMNPAEFPGFGNMLKNFWSKYIYSGFNNMYNIRNRNNSDSVLGNKMFDEYPDFQNDVDLMKDMNHDKDYDDEPDFDLGMEIDGLEKL